MTEARDPLVRAADAPVRPGLRNRAGRRAALAQLRKMRRTIKDVQKNLATRRAEVVKELEDLRRQREWFLASGGQPRGVG